MFVRTIRGERFLVSISLGSDAFFGVEECRQLT